MLRRPFRLLLWRPGLKWPSSLSPRARHNSLLQLSVFSLEKQEAAPCYFCWPISGRPSRQWDQSLSRTPFLLLPLLPLSVSSRKSPSFYSNQITQPSDNYFFIIFRNAGRQSQLYALTKTILRRRQLSCLGPAFFNILSELGMVVSCRKLHFPDSLSTTEVISAP